MSKAKTLPEVIQFFNPMQPLRAQTLKDWYIDRPGNPLEKMKKYLQGLALNQIPVKILFTGHVGSGKSTALNKLAEEIKNQFFIVPVEVRQSLNIADLTYIDLLLAIAMSLFKRATEPDVLGHAPAQIAADYWETLTGFIERAIFGPAYLQPVPPQAEASVTVNLLAAEFQAKFATEAATRETIRRHAEPRLAELHAKIDEVADLVASSYKRPVLFFVEGTDKPDLAHARQIFLNHTYSLTAFRPSVIYTFPIGLRYSTDFILFKDSFHETFLLPNLKVADQSGSPNPEGLTYLTQALMVRMETELMAEPACQALTQASGGLMRTLIRLVQRAAVNAVAAGQDKINLEHAQAAIKAEQADFIAGLKADDYPVLLARHHDKQLSADEPVLWLLETRALLEYINDMPWCDVHPIALPLVLKRAGTKEG